MKKMKLSEIKIFPSFAGTNPKKVKIKKCKDYWGIFSKQQKPIVVNEDDFLLDGYIQYLVLQEKNIEEAEVIIKHDKKFYKDNPTTYIYGIHPNSNCEKEFMWRVPESWKGFEKNVQIGDTVLCATKFGYSPVVVTKIEVLNKPPIDIPIKKVCKRKIKRNGMVVEL